MVADQSNSPFERVLAFEWDEKKRISNLEKHGIDFVDAIAIFDGPCLETLTDRHVYGEERSICYGQMEGRVLAVVCTMREVSRRIISARRTTLSESRAYWEIVYGEQ